MLDKIEKACKDSDDKAQFLNDIRAKIHELSEYNHNPVDNVIWVPIEKVCPNDYNPNSVASKEMGLLYKSIEHDGYTQPIVTYYDAEKERYIIVDGFHRYFVGKNKDNIREGNKGMVPITVIDKEINDRMASTVRHNRARGSHSIDGMGSVVFDMLKNGWKDAEICNELGMEPEELLKLKHVTGFSKLFKNVEYNKSWETDRMVKLRTKNTDKTPS